MISFLAFVFTGYLVVNWLFFPRPSQGWTSVIASVWLLGGFLMASIGLIGIYIAKVFSETKRRPNTIIRAIHGRDGAAL
jgi:putative glycosyltransferase